MDIPGPLKETYDSLSVYNRRFLEYVDQTPGGAEREVYESLFNVNDDLISMQPWPIFISRRSYEKIGETVVKLFRLLKRIPLDIFKGNHRRIADYYGISPVRAASLLAGVTQTHLDNLISRGDFIMSPSGLKCIEFNVNTNLGGLETERWQSAYLSVPLIRRFLDRQGITLHSRKLLELLLRHFNHNLVERFGNAAGPLNIGVAVHDDNGDTQTESLGVYLDAVYSKMLRDDPPGVAGSRAGVTGSRAGVTGRIVVGKYSRFAVEGDTLVCDGRPIHALAEMSNGYVPPEIMELHKQGNLLLYNGPVSWLMANKSNLALLSERANDPMFSPDEQETIRKHIPWTRKVTDGQTTYKGETVRLKDFILSHREQLVLKPPAGYGGYGIYVGCKTPEEEWRRVVRTGLEQPPPNPGLEPPDGPSQQNWDGFIKNTSHREQWLVQEYVGSCPFIFQSGEDDYEPHDGSWGFFVFGDRFGGGWVRVLPSSNPKGVVNSHQGAEATVFFEVDE